MTQLESYELDIMGKLRSAIDADKDNRYEQAYDLLMKAERLIKMAKRDLHQKYHTSGEVK